MAGTSLAVGGCEAAAQFGVVGVFDIIRMMNNTIIIIIISAFLLFAEDRPIIDKYQCMNRASNIVLISSGVAIIAGTSLIISGINYEDEDGDSGPGAFFAGLSALQ